MTWNPTPARRALLTALLATSAWTATPAFAQEAADGASEEGGDIVVTARRREERLVDVPIAVTAYSGEQLEQRGAIDITDISATTPNVTVENSRATNSTLSAFIRGVGQQDPVSGFEQGVGIYLDDVYLNRPQAAVLDIYDVERIEVLRGPQGTLYGRNTIGGAIKYVTRELPQDFSLKARATYGSYDQADGILSVSAPIGDIVRVGGSIARLSRGGFGKNLTTGLDNYNKDIWAGRATLELGGHGAPVLIRVAGDYTEDKSNPRGGHREIPGLVSGAPVLPNAYDTRGGLTDPAQAIKAYGLSMNITAELTPTLTLRSISGWRKDRSATPIDFDALPAIDVDVPGLYINEQTSQEFQLLYNSDRLHGMVGFYYLDAKADTLFDVRLFTTVNGFTVFTQANVDTETWAAFGDFTFDFTDQFSISAGGRYTWDKRFADILRQRYVGGGSPVFGGLGIAATTPDTKFQGSSVYTKFTPRVSLSFKPTADHNLYASYSQGFKGGGFDPRGVGANAPNTDGVAGLSDAEVAAYLKFRPEKVNSYEVGYKGNLLGGDLFVALAAFHTDYTDVQIPGSQACTVGGVVTFCGVVSNAGKARMNGIELETSAKLGRDLMTPGDRLGFSGSLGYIDAKYTSFVYRLGATLIDVAKFGKVQNTPKWTASGTLDYVTPVGDGALAFGATLSYRSKTSQFELPYAAIDQPGYALLDASLVYTAPNDRWSIGVHGKNLTDKRYKTSGYPYIALDATGTPILTNGLPTASLGKEGILTAFYGNPRQVFVTGTVKF